jgi:hypothetical protein
MLGFHRHSASKLSSLAAAALMLAVLTPAASFAASAERHTYPGSAHVVTQPDTRAQYPSSSDNPDSSDDPNRCIGGYRWTRHFFDANETAAESEIPVPCR